MPILVGPLCPKTDRNGPVHMFMRTGRSSVAPVRSSSQASDSPIMSASVLSIFTDGYLTREQVALGRLVLNLNPQARIFASIQQPLSRPRLPPNHLRTFGNWSLVDHPENLTLDSLNFSRFFPSRASPLTTLTPKMQLPISCPTQRQALKRFVFILRPESGLRNISPRAQCLWSLVCIQSGTLP